jgi:hypothetical protein
VELETIRCYQTQWALPRERDQGWTPGSQRLRAKATKAIIAILWMTAAGAYAQQDIDLTGYKLVFSDELTP